jgi:murein DD-endopeptidase MepM/ murein hydrolase activator NlpD
MNRGGTVWPALVALACAIAAGPNEAAAAKCADIELRPMTIALQRPVTGKGTHLSAGFGLRTHPLLGTARLHAGVDWAAPPGTAVAAAAHGRVAAAGTEGAYGKRVIVDHAGRYQTVYAQLEAIGVAVGDCVAPGDLIGRVGATGLTTGPHLHFEVRHNGQPIDPMSLQWAEPR